MDREEGERMFISLMEENATAMPEVARLKELEATVQGNELIIDGLLRRFPHLANLRPDTPHQGQMLDVAGMDRAVAARRTKKSDATTSTPLRRAVMDLLRDRRDGLTPVTSNDVISALGASGDLPANSDPNHAVRHVLRELHRAGEIERVQLDGRTFGYSIRKEAG